MNNENVIKWLQISDVHIGHQDYVESVMREELPAYVKHLAAREKFDVIFITGDLIYAPASSFKGQEQEIKDITSIQKFIQSLQSASGVKNNCTCIAIGNHDVVRTKDKDAAVKKMANNYKTQEGKIDDLGTILAAEGRFARLYEQILGEKYPLEGHYIRPLQIESANGDKQQLEILHLDTVLSAEAVYARGKTRILQDGNLIIGTKLLHDVLSSRQDSQLPILAIGHHPLSAFAAEEREAMIRELESAGIKLYLCGHTHIAEITQYGENLQQVCCGTNMEKLANQNPADMVFFTGTYNLNKGTFSVEAHQYSSLSNGKITGWASAKSSPFEQTQFEKDIKQTIFYYPKRTAPYFSIIEKYSKQIKKIMVDPGQYVDITPTANQKRPVPPVGKEKWGIYEADTGFGKTMWLRKKVSDMMKGEGEGQYGIQEVLLNKSVKCPFYINLESKRYDNKGESIINLLAKSIRLSLKSSSRFNIFSEWIVKLAESGRLTLLIDGFEKIEGRLRDDFTDTLLGFLADYPETEVLVAAKYFAFDNSAVQKKFDGFTFYQLEPFKDEQIRRYCEIWYKNEWENKDVDGSPQNRAEEIASQILKEPSLKELARVPLLLNTLLQVNQSLNTLPKNRIRLYDSFVYALLKEKKHPESDIELLAAIALKMQRERTSYFSTNHVKRIIQMTENRCDWLHYSADRKIRACDFLAEMNKNSRLLRKQENADRYVFYNDVIQDYLASVALVKGYYEELQPWMKKESASSNEDVSKHPLVVQLKSMWDYVENRNMVILTILQLNAYETYIVMDALLAHINDEKAMNKISVEVNSHLRNLLLQVIMDGANITQEQRKRAFLAVQKNNLFDLQADLLEEVFNSRFSLEFEETCSRYISELFRLLREEENPIQYLCDQIWTGQKLIIDGPELEEELYVLDGTIWSKGREYLDVYQKMAEGNGIKELVRMLELILKNDSVDGLCKRRACGVLHRLLKNEAIENISLTVIPEIFHVYEMAQPQGMDSPAEKDYKYAGIRIFDAIPLNDDTISEIKSLNMEAQRKECYKQLYLDAENPQDRANAFEAAVFCKCWNQEDIRKLLSDDKVFQSKQIDQNSLAERIEKLVAGHFFEE